MRILLSVFLFCLFVPAAFCQNRADSLANRYKNYIAKYLDKENALSGYYSVDRDGISIFQSPNSKANNNVEYKIFWTELEQTKLLFGNLSTEDLLSLLKEKKENDLFSLPIETSKGSLTSSTSPQARSLKNMRIAIDPGHTAGTIEEARVEKKFIDIKADAATGLKADVQLIEGQLNLATALLLKEELERMGAIVMLTRTLPGQTAFGVSFKQWMQTSFKRAVDSLFIINEITNDDKQFLLTKADEKEIFRKLFSSLDTKERSRKMNAFKPNLSIIIHYNVDEKNTEWKKPSSKNFNMAFVGGSFMKNELEKEIDRFEFLRLMLSDDIRNSLNFSSYMVKSFEAELNVPIAKEKNADYLHEYCLSTEKEGVYCRNLTLTRLVHGTIVYGETLYQDNIEELFELAKHEVLINDIETSKRVKQVAAAYFNGILRFSGIIK